MKIAAFVLVALLFLVPEVTSAQTSRRRGTRATTPAKTAPVAAQPTPTPAPRPVVAKPPVLLAVVNGQNITTADIETSAREEIDSLDDKITDAKNQIVEMEINTALLEAEAKRRKISSQQLYDLEVTRKVAEPTPAEIAAFVEQNRAQISNPDDPEIRKEVSVYLRNQRETKLSADLVSKLRTASPVVKGTDINTPNLAPSTVIATVAGTPILAGAVNERLKPIIYRLRLNAYSVQQPALDRAINDILLLAEASKLGVGPEELVRKEISEKIKAPTEEEVSRFYNDNKSRISGELDQVRTQIATYLQDQNRERLEKDYSDRLRKGANIRLLTSEPIAPAQTISVDDDPSKGDATAPVTIVEFTDFQCPSCAAMHPVIEEVLKSYGNKVRLVIRDFPLAQHTKARKAAEAANAAHAQGKFFEYVALLYKRQNALDVPSLKKYATELGLNRTKFDADLDSGKYAAEVRKDIDDGEIYGVESTPTLFINGVALRVLSAEGLRAAIDRGLTGATSASGK